MPPYIVSICVTTLSQVCCFLFLVDMLSYTEFVRIGLRVICEKS